MKEIIDFLIRLRENNNREWFQEHKPEYDKLRTVFIRYLEDLLQQLAIFDDDMKGLEAKDCLYRIYRDIRFSSDKTPYKTYFSAYMAKGGRKSLRAGYYLHIEPGNCLLSGGVWCPEPKLLKSLRQAVYDNVDEFLGIVEDARFKRVYPGFEGETLKIVPRPFPKDFEYPDLLKRKDYVVIGRKPETFFFKPDWMKKAAADFQVLKPFNDFLNYTVDELYE